MKSDMSKPADISNLCWSYQTHKNNQTSLMLSSCIILNMNTEFQINKTSEMIYDSQTLSRAIPIKIERIQETLKNSKH